MFDIYNQLFVFVEIINYDAPLVFFNAPGDDMPGQRDIRMHLDRILTMPCRMHAGNESQWWKLSFEACVCIAPAGAAACRPMKQQKPTGILL